MSRGSVGLSVIVLLLPLAGLAFLAGETASFEWTSLWRDAAWRASLAVTLYVTLVSTTISLLIGTWLARTVRIREAVWLSALLKLPMFVPHVAGAYLFLLLFSGGFPFYGLVEANERHHFVIIFTYVWKEVPFVFLMMLGTYGQLNRGYLDMAKTLQLTRFEQFKVAEWPFLLKPLLDSFWILVAFISFAYEVPALLGVTFPELLGVLAYERLTTGLFLNANESYAVALVWTLLISVGAFVSYLVTAKRRRRIEKGVRR
ncbi:MULTISPECIES: ABC transporter permease [unclassified Exiguobacterium]|uniref:ABC transporter permease n=1 Tax=unclassified Exiguobacterium TaxID=2644629 RepID=UPI00103B55D0|nr:MULTISPECIES: ABC transporter permease [unclassified Exiguobacterium]TCI61350.1 ABC transporter permease [Exiguobacterium sp. SH0S2]TCI80585.1 ABC transporter permease [Exiguobacterium sp. SH0S1]